MTVQQHRQHQDGDAMTILNPRSHLISDGVPLKAVNMSEGGCHQQASSCHVGVEQGGTQGVCDDLHESLQAACNVGVGLTFHTKPYRHSIKSSKTVRCMSCSIGNLDLSLWSLSVQFITPLHLTHQSQTEWSNRSTLLLSAVIHDVLLCQEEQATVTSVDKCTCIAPMMS